MRLSSPWAVSSSALDFSSNDSFVRRSKSLFSKDKQKLIEAYLQYRYEDWEEFICENAEEIDSTLDRLEEEPGISKTLIPKLPCSQILKFLYENRI